MKVFLTGATGFIGRHVMAEIHASGHDILASTLEIDKIENSPKNIRWLYGNLTDLKTLKDEIRSFNPDAVIHLAWQGIPNYSESNSRLNLNLSNDLLDFILENTDCNKIIVSGSCWEYGKQKGECKEDEPITNYTYFTWAKHSSYEYFSLRCRDKNVSFVWFRIFYVYGPKQREGALIPNLIKALKFGRTPVLKTPINKNDFVYVKDVALAFKVALEKNIISGIYNLGSGESTSVYNVCRIVEKLITGKEDLTHQALRKGLQEEKVNFWANTKKTSNSLGWKTEIPIEIGLKKMYDGY